MTTREILENIFILMDKCKIPHAYEKNTNVITVPGTKYRIVFDDSVKPWKCQLIQDDKKIYESNPTAVIFILHVRMFKGI